MRQLPATEPPGTTVPTTETQVEPGDDIPIQVVIGRMDMDDDAEFNNATLHCICARQREQTEARQRRRRQITSTAPAMAEDDEDLE